MHVGHIGIRFEKQVYEDVQQVERLLWGKNCFKVCKFAFKLSHLLYDDHVGRHFEEKTQCIFLHSQRYCVYLVQNLQC